MRTALALLAATTFACSPAETPAGAPPAVPEARPAPSLPGDLVDRVWRVESSGGVAAGTLYVFLSEGTLVVAASASTPLVGRWRFANGALTMVEESIEYPAEVLELTPDTLAIRSHNPGPPVEIRFRLASESTSPSRPR